MLLPGSATASSVYKSAHKPASAPPHPSRPQIFLLLMADVVLLGSSLLTHNRDFMFAIALVVCVTMTLTYLFIWNRMAKH